MIRSYWSVAALLCLAVAVGCGDDEQAGTGGSGGGGTGGSAGSAGMAGNGGTAGAGPEAKTQAIGVGCSNNILATQISALDWELTADPGPIVGGESVTVEFTGTAQFSESFLDVALSAIPGLNQATLDALQATALARSGLTGDGVALAEAPIPTTCNGGMNAGGACDTDDDCPPVGYFECVQVVDFPISTDCSEGGECDQLGKLGQCNAGSPTNDFCITGPLPIPMNTVAGTFTADASGGTVLLGWDDQNTGATTESVYGCAMGGTECDPANDQMDGSNTDCEPVEAANTCDEFTGYALPAAATNDPLGPNGLKVTAGTLAVALNCTMATDLGLDPTAVGPTPDEELISFDIE